MTYQDDAVPCGEREHVGAGDDPRARALQPPLRAVDDLEPPQAFVRDSVLLRRVVRHRIQQNRRVTALATRSSHFVSRFY
jgi:hypothetical protein